MKEMKSSYDYTSQTSPTKKHVEPFVYIPTIDVDGVPNVLHGDIDDKNVMFVFTCESQWRGVREFFLNTPIKNKCNTLTYRPTSIGDLVSTMQRLGEKHAFIVHTISENHGIKNHSLVSIEELAKLVDENGPDYVPQWIIDIRK